MGTFYAMYTLLYSKRGFFAYDFGIKPPHYDMYRILCAYRIKGKLFMPNKVLIIGFSAT